MKYAKYQINKKAPAAGLHPAWRGIGCILWILDPVMSYALAALTVGLLGRNGMIPPGLMGYVHFPDWVMNTPTLNVLARFIGSLNNLYAMLIFFFVFVIILAGIFITLYMSLFRFVGPPRYTPFDAPPPKKRKMKSMSR